MDPNAGVALGVDAAFLGSAAGEAEGERRRACGQGKCFPQGFADAHVAFFNSARHGVGEHFLHERQKAGPDRQGGPRGIGRGRDEKHAAAMDRLFDQERIAVGQSQDRAGLRIRRKDQLEVLAHGNVEQSGALLSLECADDGMAVAERVDAGLRTEQRTEGGGENSRLVGGAAGQFAVVALGEDLGTEEEDQVAAALQVGIENAALRRR